MCANVFLHSLKYLSKFVVREKHSKNIDYLHCVDSSSTPAEKLRGSAEESMKVTRHASRLYIISTTAFVLAHAAAAFFSFSYDLAHILHLLGANFSAMLVDFNSECFGTRLSLTGA